MIKNITNNLLYKYDSSGYVIKSRAGFIFYLIVTMLSITLILLVSQIYLQLNNPAYNYKIQPGVIVPLATAFIIDLILMITLLRGHFSIAGNLLFVICQTGVWTVMFLSRSDVTTRLDTIILAAATLTMMPIIIIGKKRYFFLYTALNIAVLFAFMLFFRKDLNLSGTAFIDYIFDNTLAFIFIGIVSSVIFSINSRALEKAEVEISEREKAVEQRNRLQEQLMQSQKLESVGLLAGGVAHDFNNILAAVQGFAELAINNCDSEGKTKSELYNIIKASKKARDLTHQLLAFARIQPLDMQQIDVNRIIEDFTGMLSRTLRENIIIKKRLCKNPGLLECDPVQLEQVILNLTLNSQDAMPHGGAITIETSRILIEDDFARQHENFFPGSYILLSISDSGSGVDPDIINKIFDPFFTTKDFGKGTGLGLSTVYGIIRQHKGMINVYSEKDKGTIFKIYLPVKDGILEDCRPAAGQIEHYKGNETILAVEDNPEVRNLLEAILKKNGYRTLIAENAAAAIAICSCNEVIDLLITDVILPDSNGRELCNKITAARPEIKTIYISGYTSNVIAHNGKLDEGINFIQKPFSITEFARKVREVLDSR